MNPLPRGREAELMDGEIQDPEELEASLRQVHQANTLFGGRRGLRRHLAQYRRSREPILLLDVGTGRGDTPVELVSWARRAGARWRAVAVDPHPAVAPLAARRVQGEAEVSVVRADGLRLPFPARSFDVVFAVLTLHHLDDGPARAMVAEMGRVARQRVLVSDLERNRVNHWLARLMASTLWRRNRITRHDAPASVLRGFTREELLGIGEDAGLRDLSITRHLPYRLVLAGSPGREV